MKLSKRHVILLSLIFLLKCLLIYAHLSTILGAKNMLYLYLKLTLPNMDSSHGDILQPRNEMNSQMKLE